MTKQNVLNADRSSTRTLFIRGIPLLYVFSLAIAPFYFGGERLLAWGLTGLLQGVVGVGLAFLPFPSSHIPPVERYIKFIAMICLLIAFSWAVVQILPITPQNMAHPIWTMAGDALNADLPALVSVSPDEGFLTIIKIMIVLLTFFNASMIGRLDLDPYRLLVAISAAAGVYAIIGLVWLQLFPDRHFWLQYSPYQKSLVSTFVNRNSFAQYLGMASLCVLAYIFHVGKVNSLRISSFVRLQFYLRDTFTRFVFAISLFCILLLCILLTASRGGVYSCLAGYAVFLIALVRIANSRLLGFALYPAIYLTAGYLVYDIFAARLGERNFYLTNDYALRLELYEHVWGLIQARPVTGYGLGGFEAAFRAFVPIDFDPFGIWHRAHNVYLDAAVALGLPAAFLALFVVLTPLFIHIVRLFRHASTLSILVLSLYVQLMIHSSFDFGLQTGANAVTVAAILGASLTQSRRRQVFDK